jgi:hypothetical protein
MAYRFNGDPKGVSTNSFINILDLLEPELHTVELQQFLQQPAAVDNSMGRFHLAEFWKHEPSIWFAQGTTFSVAPSLSGSIVRSRSTCHI